MRRNPPGRHSLLKPKCLHNMTLEAIAEALVTTRAPLAEVPAEPGVFAVFITSPHRLPAIEVDTSGLLFIGMSKSNLRSRIRSTHRQSAVSTLRRSLGALLKQPIGLRAIPPEPPALAVNRHHYQFSEEAQLDEWMDNCLTYGFCLIARQVRTMEKALIKRLQPPLNLISWNNPQAEKVKALRDICRREAWGRIR
jgi:hypothetical protein